mmetsp:Transcript_17698/g.31220  ORF Transcript_17698/g.31220 Transcript_17698/m.31220 type:complete len:107 (-) Transcript_17698:37-357(-)
MTVPLPQTLREAPQSKLLQDSSRCALGEKRKKEEETFANLRDHGTEFTCPAQLDLTSPSPASGRERVRKPYSEASTGPRAARRAGERLALLVGGLDGWLAGRSMRE